jgi:hypothetical protein
MSATIGSGIGSGIEYPTLIIEGRAYVVKFGRAAMYRLDKQGFDLRTLPTQINGWFPKLDEFGKEIPGSVRYSVLIDVLHAAVGDQLRCTTEELAEMVGPERTPEVAMALIQSLSKMQPSAKPTLQEPAAAMVSGEKPN